jgi:fumarate hydratase, class II
LELNVMMPVIAHHLFDMISILTNAIKVFTGKCIEGIQANPEKAAFWLEKNPILATALTPLIGYEAAAELVQEATSSGLSLWELAVRKAQAGELVDIQGKNPVTIEQIENTLSDVRRMTGI